MIAWGLLGVLLLADTEEEGARLLRIAYASQYEWREDRVENATLDFAYTSSWKGRRPEDERKVTGKGQVVVVGHEIVRSHYPGADEAMRGQLAEHLAWVVARFARRPFEEEFKDAKFSVPEKLSDGSMRVRAGDRVFLLKDDRIVGMELDVGSAAMPFVTRVECGTGDLGGGYAILSARLGYTRAGAKWTVERTMEPAKEQQTPTPASYTFVAEDPVRGRAELRIDFAKVTTNAADPVVGDPAARDALRAAWARRYVLPPDARIDGEFQRKVDRDLAKIGWTGLVKGDFQVVRTEPIEVVLDDKLFRNPQWAQGVADTCKAHFRWCFAFLRAREFEEEFKGCGFRQAGETIEVVGYEGALAFRLDEGHLVAYEENVPGGGGWWEFKLKQLKDDLVRLESMSTVFGGEQVELDIRYQRVKGVDVPSSFDVLGIADRRIPESGFGIATYELKKLRLTRN